MVRGEYRVKGYDEETAAAEKEVLLMRRDEQRRNQIGKQKKKKKAARGDPGSLQPVSHPDDPRLHFVVGLGASAAVGAGAVGDSEEIVRFRFVRRADADVDVEATPVRRRRRDRSERNRKRGRIVRTGPDAGRSRPRTPSEDEDSEDEDDDELGTHSRLLEDDCFELPLQVCAAIPFFSKAVERARKKLRMLKRGKRRRRRSRDKRSPSEREDGEEEENREDQLDAILREYRGLESPSTTTTTSSRRGDSSEDDDDDSDDVDYSDFVIDIADSPFSRESIELATRLVRDRLDLSQYFFEEFRRNNLLNCLFQSVSGFVNCCLILLENGKLFFYYRSGTVALKVLGVYDYYVVGGLEITTRLGNFLFLHDSCRCFFDRKYRKSFDVNVLRAIRFPT